MNQKMMEQYAEFIVQVGVNVQKNQTLIINCPLDAAYFARACMKAALQVGARDVVIRYTDEKAERIRLELAEESVLCDVKPYVLRLLCAEHLCQRPGGL